MELHIEDVNEAPLGVTLLSPPGGASVPEDSAPGAHVLRFIVDDPDGVTTLPCMLTRGGATVTPGADAGTTGAEISTSGADTGPPGEETVTRPGEETQQAGEQTTAGTGGADLPFELQEEGETYEVVIARDARLDYEELAEFTFGVLCVDGDLSVSEVLVIAVTDYVNSGACTHPEPCDEDKNNHEELSHEKRDCKLSERHVDGV